jgi:hypothetical protein
MTTIFFHLFLLLLFLDPGSGSQDPGSGMGKIQDPGSGIRDKHPGSATLNESLESGKKREGHLFGFKEKKLIFRVCPGSSKKCTYYLRIIICHILLQTIFFQFL